MEKGFTLIELLAVLFILSLITLVAVPNIINTNKQSVDNDYEQFKLTVQRAAEVYIETHQELKDGTARQVMVSTLTMGGYINESLVNPKTNKPVSDNEESQCYVNVSKDVDVYKYEYSC